MGGDDAGYGRHTHTGSLEFRIGKYPFESAISTATLALPARCKRARSREVEVSVDNLQFDRLRGGKSRLCARTAASTAVSEANETVNWTKL